MPSDQQLRQTIADLKALEKASFGSRQRFAFYAYLSAVFAFYTSLRQKNEAKISAHRIAKLFGIRTQKRTHSIRVIIDATSLADKKTKSRFSRALRYAWRERKRWKKLPEFLRLNGGPAGAAATWSALHPRTPKSYVKMGGDHRVRKIPLLADVERIMPGQMFVKGGRVFRQPDATETVDSNPVSKGVETTEKNHKTAAWHHQKCIPICRLAADEADDESTNDQKTQRGRQQCGLSVECPVI